MNPLSRHSLPVLLVLTFLVFCGCSHQSETDPRLDYSPPDPADLSSLTWTEAFQKAHEKISREYAFSEWKSVDWHGLYSRFQPRIEQAEIANDEKSYYLALHEYLCAIPDGHVSLKATNPAVPKAIGEERAGGGFGMALAELDEGRVIAGVVVTGGPAHTAGIATGAEIVTWAGQPVKQAITAINVGAIPFKTLTAAPGGETPQATREHYRLEQTKLLTRGPVGSSVSVEFKNPGQPAETVHLTAVDDAGESLSWLNFTRQADFSREVEYKILEKAYGYILVRMEFDLSNPDGYPTRILQKFREAIVHFVEEGVAGIIIDLRGNYGGADALAADMCGFFYDQPSFYECFEMYDKRDGGFPRITFDERHPDVFVDYLAINPQTPYFGGPVAVLVNPATISSGEGPAMCLSRLPQGRVIGFHGTNGSFGMVGGAIMMPKGYKIGYPYGRSVGKNGVIQLDSRNGVGGVAPDPRVPKTAENVLAFGAGMDVELNYAIHYLKEWGTPNR